MSIQEWQEVSREEAYKKYSRKIEKVVFELPNGKTDDFYIKKEGPAAGVLALTADKQVILVRQFRPGPKQILNELPGGFVDPGETADQTVRREFMEETGYDGDFQLVGTCLDDAYSTMLRYCYVATNCHKVGEPQQTDTEQVEVVLLPLEDFRKHLRTGRLTDVEVAYLGLDHLSLLGKTEV